MRSAWRGVGGVAGHQVVERGARCRASAPTARPARRRPAPRRAPAAARCVSVAHAERVGQAAGRVDGDDGGPAARGGRPPGPAPPRWWSCRPRRCRSTRARAPWRRAGRRRSSGRRPAMSAVRPPMPASRSSARAAHVVGVEPGGEPERERRPGRAGGARPAGRSAARCSSARSQRKAAASASAGAAGGGQPPGRRRQLGVEPVDGRVDGVHHDRGRAPRRPGPPAGRRPRRSR